MADIITKEFVAEERKVERAIQKNPWMVISIILAVLLVVAVFMIFRSNSGISETKAADKLLENLNGMVGGGVTLINTSSLGSLYEVSVSYQGQAIPVYITKDGKYMAVGVQEIKTGAAVNASNTANASTANPSTPAKEVTKSDKPVVQAFVFAYCPYGLQFEKALSPVYDLLKNKADINIVFIGAMHDPSSCSGATCFEKTESLRQISILKLYGKDKLFAYLKEFDTNANIGSCSGDATCLDKYLPAIYTKLAINKANVDTYMTANAPQVYSDNMARAKTLGISGSPTFVINGVQDRKSVV
jgi:protein-disulfide isomerase